jgi:glycosyltransferase involved in cell wall biosynthesis
VRGLVAQAAGRRFEVIVVDDRSNDGSRAVARALCAADQRVRLVETDGHGAAAAINRGVREARYELVCQVDQDVEVLDGWLSTLVDALDDPSVGAAQAVYVPDPGAPLLARVMALDLAQRYGRIAGPTDHVCTGNTAYRKRALFDAGLFDETMGYGYDNDISYRLGAAAYQLVIRPEARSVHHWRASVRGYLTQQYGFGYGRLDLLARHPRRAAGDAVSPAPMMAHPVVLAGAVGMGVVAAVLAGTGRDWKPAALVAALLVSSLVLERTFAGVRAARRFGDRGALAFPIVHLARDAAWLAAIVVWVTRRLLGRPARPAHSMAPRT